MSNRSWAVVTGGSTGLGRALAALLAADGYPLVLVARNAVRLRETAEALQLRHGVSIRTVPVDLAEPGAAVSVETAVRDLPVSVLVNNAAFGQREWFAAGALSQQLALLHTNIVAVVELTRRLLPALRASGNGRILNVASTAAYLPGAGCALYYASKAFVHSFSVALGEELAGAGVTVTTLCPGPTETEFHRRAGMEHRFRGWMMMSADAVARAGYRGMLRGRRVVIPGWSNRVGAVLSKLCPATLTVKFSRRINQPEGPP